MVEFRSVHSRRRNPFFFYWEQMQLQNTILRVYKMRVRQWKYECESRDVTFTVSKYKSGIESRLFVGAVARNSGAAWLHISPPLAECCEPRNYRQSAVQPRPMHSRKKLHSLHS